MQTDGLSAANAVIEGLASSKDLKQKNYCCNDMERYVDSDTYERDRSVPRAHCASQPTKELTLNALQSSSSKSAKLTMPQAP